MLTRIGSRLALLLVIVATIGCGWLRTGVFNLADVAIMLGAAIFVLAELRRSPSRPAPTLPT